MLSIKLNLSREYSFKSAVSEIKRTHAAEDPVWVSLTTEKVELCRLVHRVYTVIPFFCPKNSPGTCFSNKVWEVVQSTNCKWNTILEFSWASRHHHIGQTLKTLSRSLCLSQSQSQSNCTQPIRRCSSHSQSAALTPDWKGCVLEKYSRDVNTVVLYTVCCWYVNATKINIECGCMFVCSCSDRDVPGSRPNVCVQLFTSQRKAFVYICLGHFFWAVFEFCDALPFSNSTAC